MHRQNETINPGPNFVFSSLRNKNRRPPIFDKCMYAMFCAEFTIIYIYINVNHWKCHLRSSFTINMKIFKANYITFYGLYFYPFWLLEWLHLVRRPSNIISIDSRLLTKRKSSYTRSRFAQIFDLILTYSFSIAYQPIYFYILGNF